MTREGSTPDSRPRTAVPKAIGTSPKIVPGRAAQRALDPVEQLDDLDLAGEHREERAVSALVNGEFPGSRWRSAASSRDARVRPAERREQRDADSRRWSAWFGFRGMRDSPSLSTPSGARDIACIGDRGHCALACEENDRSQPASRIGICLKHGSFRRRRHGRAKAPGAAMDAGEDGLGGSPDGEACGQVRPGHAARPPAALSLAPLLPGRRCRRRTDCRCSHTGRGRQWRKPAPVRNSQARCGNPRHRLAEMRHDPDAIRRAFETGEYPYHDPHAREGLSRTHGGAAGRTAEGAELGQGDAASASSSCSRAATPPARAARSSASWSISIRAARASSRWRSRPTASGRSGTSSATSSSCRPAGEIVFFDRSWYNRAGVERVMGFCTPNEYLEFMRQCPELERMLVRSGIRLFKYWFSVTRDEQLPPLQGARDRSAEAVEAVADRPRLARQVGRLHRGQGGDVLLHRHRRRALDDREVRRQEAGAAGLHARHFLSTLDYPDKGPLRHRPDPLIVDSSQLHVIGHDQHILASRFRRRSWHGRRSPSDQGGRREAGPSAPPVAVPGAAVLTASPRPVRMISRRSPRALEQRDMRRARRIARRRDRPPRISCSSSTPRTIRSTGP